VLPWTRPQEAGPTAAPQIYEGFPVSELLTNGWPEDELNHALSSLNAAGLIQAHPHPHPLADGLGVYLTANGTAAAKAIKATAAEAAAATKAAAEEAAAASEERVRLARRNNPSLRRDRACSGLLYWLNHRDLNGVGPGQLSQFLTTGLAQHEGETLSLGEIERAATYLKKLHLVELVPTGYRIHANGSLCVNRYNGDVNDYQRDRPPASGQIIKIKDSSGINIAGGDVNIGIPVENLASFAQMLLREIPRMQLDKPQQAELQGILTELQQYSTGGSSETAQRAFSKMVGYLADAGKPVLTAVFALVAQHWGLRPS
jgi:hypothetical protein